MSSQLKMTVLFNWHFAMKITGFLLKQLPAPEQPTPTRFILLGVRQRND